MKSRLHGFRSNAGRITLAAILFSALAGAGWSQAAKPAAGGAPRNWAERLGYPAGKRVVILHADDFGMCTEANEATFKLFRNRDIQSAAAMPACPGYEEAIEWAKRNPEADVGMHLTLTSEMKSPRWGPVTDPRKVPGLLAPDGYMWRRQIDVATHATAAEVEQELRAQIEKTLQMGYRPVHMDTHAGTVYGTDGFMEAYFKLAVEYQIVATAFEDPEVLEQFMKYIGLPALTARQKELIRNYPLPKLDNFIAVPNGETYEEKRARLMELVRSLKPGLIEIAFHPQVKSERSESLTRVWQQRVWETDLFSDPTVKQFFRDEGLVFTNWKEIMQRFNRAGSTARASAAARPGPVGRAELPPNTLTPAEKSAGWRLLFDGQSLAGWRGFKSEIPGASWRVAGGVLQAQAPRKDDLVTVDAFGDFELSIEWRIAAAGNSGILYRVGLGEAETYRTGPEYQLLDNAAAKGREKPTHRAGALYDLVAPQVDNARPAGEWNETRIIVVGWRVEHWLNGARLLACDLASREGKALIAASKFGPMTTFAKLPRGHIALQDYGNEVAFRSVKIRELR